MSDSLLIKEVSKQRGEIISQVVLLEKMIDIFIASHFCTGKKKWELIEVIIATNRITLENKVQVFKVLLEKHYKLFLEKHKTIHKDLIEIVEIRNIFAHYMMFSGESALEKYKKDGTITLVKFKNDATYLEFTPKEIQSILTKAGNYTSIIRENFLKT